MGKTFLLIPANTLTTLTTNENSFSFFLVLFGTIFAHNQGASFFV